MEKKDAEKSSEGSVTLIEDEMHNGFPEKARAEEGGQHLAPGPHHVGKHELGVIEQNAVALDEYAHTSIPREHVSFEERVWYANYQRRTYGMHASNGSKTADAWFHWFDNPVGPLTDKNPLICRHEPYDGEDKIADFKASRWDNVQTEAAHAKSMVRVATWTGCFYLITTDALGPFNAPFAISQLGWVPGMMSYFALGVAAFWSCWLITNVFLRLDSDRHPVRTFADLSYVFFGSIGFYVTVFCQIMMLFISGSANLLGGSQSVYLLQNNDPFCFIATMALLTLAPFVISLPLRKIGWLSWACSMNVYLNLLILFLSMGFFAHSDPNFAAAQAAYGTTVIPGPPFAPVTTETIVTGLPLATRVNGISNAIYAWGAIMMFVEFLAEMRRPNHFWRSFSGGLGLCAVVYFVYGAYTYHYQGQYTQSLSYQGIGNYNWASACNGISVVTQVVACVLYTHIAMKVFWQTIMEDVFKLPSVQIGVKGWMFWIILNICVYPLVFVVSAAIPQLFTISALFAALFGSQFSYVFPPLLQLAYDVCADASRLDEVYVPGEKPRRYDTWMTASRWMRGLFGGTIFSKCMKLINLLYFLASLSLVGLASWGSIIEMEITFENGAGTSFGCSPFV